MSRCLFYFNHNVKVETWMKPNVSQRGTGGNGTTHIVKFVLLKKVSKKQYNSSEISRILRRVPGSHTNFRSIFNGKRAEHCYKIPREQVDKEIFEIIDSCECN